MKSLSKIIAALTLVLCTTSFSQATGDLNTLRMRVFQQILDNQQMRILEIDLAPGETVNVNSHPDHQAYAATDGTLTVTTPDGKTKNISIKAGDPIWQIATNYVTVNTGAKAFKAVIVEPK